MLLRLQLPPPLPQCLLGRALVFKHLNFKGVPAGLQQPSELPPQDRHNRSHNIAREPKHLLLRLDCHFSGLLLHQPEGLSEGQGLLAHLQGGAAGITDYAV